MPDPRYDRDRHEGERRRLADYEGGYGGGRERAEEGPEHEFGRTGWGGGRAHHDDDPHQAGGRREFPEGVHPVPDGPGWQERYARENADKYGQAGGQPIEQRGASQSMGGYEQREQGLGDTRGLSPRGGVGSRDVPTRERGREAEQPRGRFAGKGPKSYTRSDDRITDDICHRLTDHSEVDASEIHIEVRNGEVTLSGSVNDRRERWLAEEVAAEVHGVKEIHNQIRVAQRQ